MKLSDHFLSLIKTRLEQSEAVVVYDPAGRWLPSLKTLGQGAGITLIDVAGEGGSLLAREKAWKAWTALSEVRKGSRKLILHVPWAAPQDDDARLSDPFSALAAMSSIFPSGEGESYKALCFFAKREFREAVEKLFSVGEPNLEEVESLSGGSHWPRLKSFLGGESASELIQELLSRSELAISDAVLPELQDFLLDSLGLDLGTIKDGTKIRQALCRFLLFSEFCFDLEEELPATLQRVARAGVDRRTLVDKVCESWRNDSKRQDDYRDIARQVEAELRLPELCAGLQKLGRRDTFPFEERCYCKIVMDHLRSGRLSEARAICQQRQSGNRIWVNDGLTGSIWTLISRTLDLLEKIHVASAPRPSADAKSLIENYVAGGWQIDRSHRLFEQTLHEMPEREAGAELEILGRQKWREWADRQQTAFIRACEQEGWPNASLTRHVGIFTRWLKPEMESNKRCALLMVDAWRYEIAADFLELNSMLNLKLHGAAGQLPSITPVGMASLLPGAERLLIRDIKGKMEAVIDDKPIRNPDDRLAHSKTIYGDRCKLVDLSDVVRGSKFIPAADLLLVKTTEIDTAGEHLTEDAPSVIANTLKRLSSALANLAQAGYEHIVLSSDHGFVLLGENDAGNVMERPEGQWLLDSRRVLLGKSAKSGNALRLDAGKLGVPYEGEIVVPRSLGSFRPNQSFFHGGLSLQESVLPVLIYQPNAAAMSTAKPKSKKAGPSIVLSYRGGRKTVTARMVAVDIKCGEERLLQPSSIELNFQVLDGKKEIGHLVPNAQLNPSTGYLLAQEGEQYRITVQLEDDFYGKFTVVASDPATQLDLATLELEICE